MTSDTAAESVKEKQQSLPPTAPRTMRPATVADEAGNSSAKSSDKKKESLGRVPCKFFKAGACTNTECPFLHQEHGTPKQVCPWYQSNQCKFGSKCALAHVLPGQPMSMDRKNKRAQQQAQREADAHASSGTALPQSPPKQQQQQQQQQQPASSTSPTKKVSGFFPAPAVPSSAAVHSEATLASQQQSLSPNEHHKSSVSPSTTPSKSVWGPNMNPAVRAPPPSSSASGTNGSAGPSRQVGFAPPAASSDLSGTSPAAAAAASSGLQASSAGAISPLSPKPQQEAAPGDASTVTSPLTSKLSNMSSAHATASSPPTPAQSASFQSQSPSTMLLDLINGRGPGPGKAAGLAGLGVAPPPELSGAAADFHPKTSNSPVKAPHMQQLPSASAWAGGARGITSGGNGVTMPQSMPANGTHAFGTSPFSNPGSRSIFLQPSSFGSDDATLDAVFEKKAQQQQQQQQQQSQTHVRRPGASPWAREPSANFKPASFSGFRRPSHGLTSDDDVMHDLHEDELREDVAEEQRAEEDFLPSSLHDLLTPEELQRSHQHRFPSGKQGSLISPPSRAQPLPALSASLQQVPVHQQFGSQSKDPWGIGSSSYTSEHGAIGPPTSTAQDQASFRDGFLLSPNVVSPSRNRTLMSHAPGSSLPPGLASGMSRLHLQPAPTQSNGSETPASSLNQSSPWGASSRTSAAGLGLDPQPGSSPRPSAIGRRTSAGSASHANSSGLFVGSPLAQAWTHPNENDEAAPPGVQTVGNVTAIPPSKSFNTRGATVISAAAPQASLSQQMSQAPSNATAASSSDDDEGLPFSMD